MSRKIALDDVSRVASIPQPTEDLQSILQAVLALKATVEVLARQGRDTEQSAVRLRELERLGLIKIYSDGTVFSDILGRIEALE